MRSVLLLTTLLLLSACSAVLGLSASPAEPSRSAGSYVDLLEASCDKDGGMVRFTGRVVNTHQARGLELVRLRGILYDEAGVEVSSNWGLAGSDEIAPGGRSAFRFYIDGAPDGDHCELKVESARFTD